MSSSEGSAGNSEHSDRINVYKLISKELYGQSRYYRHGNKPDIIEGVSFPSMDSIAKIKDSLLLVKVRMAESALKVVYDEEYDDEYLEEIFDSIFEAIEADQFVFDEDRGSMMRAREIRDIAAYGEHQDMLDSLAEARKRFDEERNEQNLELKRHQDERADARKELEAAIGDEELYIPYGQEPKILAIAKAYAAAMKS